MLLKLFCLPNLKVRYLRCGLYFFNSIKCLSFQTVIAIFFLFVLNVHGQVDTTINLTFDFNEHEIKEKDNKVTPRFSGVILADDRFGNDKSAVRLRGDVASYLSLSTSKLLKSSSMTISFWLNLDRRNYAGKGNDCNPFVTIKNGPGEDFINAIGVGYAPVNELAGVIASKDSTEEAFASDDVPFTFNKWHHYVVVCNNNYLAFYADGKLKEKTVKAFETKFLETDSMLVGHTGSKKNERMSTGVFDDIKIFHRSLSDKEVLELYNDPNPNELKNLINEILKYGLIVLVFVIIIIVIIIINKRALRKQKEKLELSNKLSDMELKMVKAQMNPHFVFNSLNSIKHFVMKKENDKAEMYLSKFAKLTRGLLESSTKESLTVKEEVDIITGYIEMESLRFGKSFSYLVDVDAAINQEQTHIPHMMIQPFVENAIWHGLLNKENNRILNVSFTLESNNSITCVVDDNGIGRAKSSQKETSLKKTSLALSFVTRRLELMRETLKINCSINIVDKVDEAGESKGTKVIIILPILKGSLH